ncbi:MAG TPA: hypothetical protein VFQ36_24045 [Ktedonobacteraceae bacterium]|nr:hypothetical protein [Ktedonobacteraceae bacterium]
MSSIEEGMTDWPDYVEYAFSAIWIIGTDEEYIQDFSTRWGGLDLANFAQALHEGTFKDQQVAAFALGYSGSTWARDLLQLHRLEVRTGGGCG